MCRGRPAAEHVKDDADEFLREPAWVCLRPTGRTRDLVLVNYHAIYDAPADVRRREIMLLGADRDGDGVADDLVREIRATRPQPIDVVLLGDFNVESSEVASALPAYRDLVRGNGSTLNLRDQITENLYDHILIGADDFAAGEVSSAEVIDVRGVAHGDTFYRSISDHLPVRFVLGNPAEP